MTTYLFKIGKARHLIRKHYPHAVHTRCGRSFSKPIGAHTLVTDDAKKCDCFVCLRSHRKAMKART